MTANQVYSVDAVTMTETEVVARRSKLAWLYVHNADTGTRWVHVYDDLAANVDPTTSAGDWRVSVPAGTAIMIPFGSSLDTGLCLAASDSPAAGGVAATALSILVGYG